MSKVIKNLPASIHDRLRSLARNSRRPFQEFFYYYAIERFLYRLFNSPYKERFVLKGGLMFLGWGIPLRRPTRDIDVQGYLENSVDNLVTIVRDTCLLEVEPDGMYYDPGSVWGEQINESANYPGVRVYFTGYLGKALIKIHLDASFANVITPAEFVFDYPSLLGMPEFTLRGYPVETAIAEKLQTMVDLENINDRMKDFYDIWLLSRQVDIPGQILAEAIKATFTARRTPLPEQIPIALSEDFAHRRASDWDRFLNRSLLKEAEIPAFNLVLDTLRQFLYPVLLAAYNNTPFEQIWRAGDAWWEE